MKLGLVVRMNKVSAVTVAKDAIKRHSCLFENMVNLLTVMDEVLIIDAGSKDGTYERLLDIAANNLKVTVDSGENCMNTAIQSARYERVLYFYQDEVFPVELLRKIRINMFDGYPNLIFWDLILRNNFQSYKREPDLIRRTGWRDHLTVDSPVEGDVKLCSERLQWRHPWDINEVHRYIEDFVFGVVSGTAFINQAKDRFESDFGDTSGIDFAGWYRDAVKNPEWMSTESPFEIPPILRHHLGKTKYELRPEIIQALKRNDTYYLSQEGLNV
jgi:glycosyltransferase involved in cell wall biosynthesis